MNAMEKPTRNRRGTIFGMAAGSDEVSELRAELLIAQSMNKRLMHKERRMQVGYMQHVSLNILCIFSLCFCFLFFYIMLNGSFKKPADSPSTHGNSNSMATKL